jgi:hypothetical protein
MDESNAYRILRENVKGANILGDLRLRYTEE